MVWREGMKEKDMKQIQMAIRKIAKKYNIKQSSFTGECNGEYIGFITDPQTPLNLVQCAYNVGRMWQHVRTLVRDSLDRFEA